ncbi:hypothetical protein BJ912DRAFT_1013727 [Pholiota molesta]|nr:hypothetical protein BJ912DRAFT_1013727 [Pholiota molesta]
MLHRHGKHSTFAILSTTTHLNAMASMPAARDSTYLLQLLQQVLDSPFTAQSSAALAALLYDQSQAPSSPSTENPLPNAFPPKPEDNPGVWIQYTMAAMAKLCSLEARVTTLEAESAYFQRRQVTPDKPQEFPEDNAAKKTQKLQPEKIKINLRPRKPYAQTKAQLRPAVTMRKNRSKAKRQEQRAARDPTNNKRGLEDLADALGLVVHGTTDDLITRIRRHFHNFPALREDHRYSGLFPSTSPNRELSPLIIPTFASINHSETPEQFNDFMADELEGHDEGHEGQVFYYNYPPSRTYDYQTSSSDADFLSLEPAYYTS